MKLTIHVDPTMVPELKLAALLDSIASRLRGTARCRTVTIHLRPGANTAGVLPSGYQEVQKGQSKVVSIEQGLAPKETQDVGRSLDVESEARQLAAERGNDPLCCVPLLLDRRRIGTLALKPPGEAVVGRDDLDFLSQLADHVAHDIENAIYFGASTPETCEVEWDIDNEITIDGIIGRSPALRRVLAQVSTVAPTDATVLLYGETGTGKEVIAHAIHQLSLRTSGNFIRCNCAALPTGLLDTELFGHEKGAFTGALSQRIGRFELADRGTIFLDEIAEMSLELQPKLLRVLQEKEFERIGSSQTLNSDARLIARDQQGLEPLG